MGSYRHADSMRTNAKPCKYMVSLEMIGYFNDEPGSQEYPIRLLQWFYPSKGNFITVVGNMGNRRLIREFKVGNERIYLIACVLHKRSPKRFQV